MSYVIQNNSNLSQILAKAIKAELVQEGSFSPEVVELVVNHFNLEERGLGAIVAEIIKTVRTVTNEF